MSESDYNESDYPDWVEPLLNEEYLDFAMQPVYNQMGEAGFALLAATVLTIGMWSYTETMMAPAIMLALFGGTLIVAVPGAAAFVGVVIVATGVTLALLSIWG